MAKQNKGKRFVEGERVQFLTGRPHRTVPGFPETARGVVTALQTNGKLTIKVGKKVYRDVSIKICNKV